MFDGSGGGDGGDGSWTAGNFGGEGKGTGPWGGRGGMFGPFPGGLPTVSSFPVDTGSTNALVTLLKLDGIELVSMVGVTLSSGESPPIAVDIELSSTELDAEGKLLVDNVELEPEILSVGRLETAESVSTLEVVVFGGSETLPTLGIELVSISEDPDMVSARPCPCTVMTLNTTRT